MNSLFSILKIIVVVGVVIIALSYILMITDIITNKEMQETLWKTIKVLAVITVAAGAIIFVSKLSNKTK